MLSAADELRKVRSRRVASLRSAMNKLTQIGDQCVTVSVQASLPSRHVCTNISIIDQIVWIAMVRRLTYYSRCDSVEHKSHASLLCIVREPPLP